MNYNICVGDGGHGRELGRVVFQTDNRDEVLPAFSHVISNAALQGKPLFARVLCKGRIFVEHRFDASPDSPNCFIGKLDTVLVPSPFGRPAKLHKGRNVTMFLPQDLQDAARKLGNGNLSEGVRIALLAATKT